VKRERRKNYPITPATPWNDEEVMSSSSNFKMSAL